MVSLPCKSQLAWYVSGNSMASVIDNKKPIFVAFLLYKVGEVFVDLNLGRSPIFSTKAFVDDLEVVILLQDIS